MSIFGDLGAVTSTTNLSLTVRPIAPLTTIASPTEAVAERPAPAPLLPRGLLTGETLRKVSKLNFYTAWRSYAPGSPDVGVPSGIALGAPPPAEGGSWKDYYTALMFELKDIVVKVSNQHGSACADDRISVVAQRTQQGIKRKLVPNLARCVERQIEYSFASPWGKKVRAAMTALMRSGQDARPLIGALRVGVFDQVMEYTKALRQYAGYRGSVGCTPALKWERLHPDQHRCNNEITKLPNLDRSQIGEELDRIYAVARADYQKLQRLANIVSVPRPDMRTTISRAGLTILPPQQSPPDPTKTGACKPGEKQIGLMGGTPQCVPDIACPQGTDYDPVTGQCVQLVQASVALPEKEKPDYGKYALYAGIGIVALGGIYMATKARS